jgi:nucleoside-diphosphate-sugar epimerase
VDDATSILVTGASGFIGARVVAHALECGYSVTALVRPDSHLHRLEHLRNEVDVVRADVTDRRALERVVATVAPDACVHLAAAGAVVREDDIDTVVAANALAPAHLAAALARTGCRRLVTAGSSSEYGTVEGVMDETAAPLPDDVYGVAKLAGGLLAAVAGAGHGLETAHLRLFSVYGPGEDPRRLVSSVVRALLAGEPIALTPGAQVRDFVYVDDVAEALVAAVRRPGLDRMTVNVGTGVQTSVRELAGIAADIAGGHDLLRFGAVAYRPGERFSWRASTARAEQVLGWRARTSLRDGLARTIEHARSERFAEVA